MSALPGLPTTQICQIQGNGGICVPQRGTEIARSCSEPRLAPNRGARTEGTRRTAPTSNRQLFRAKKTQVAFPSLHPISPDHYCEAEGWTREGKYEKENPGNPVLRWSHAVFVAFAAQLRILFAGAAADRSNVGR